MKVSISEIFTSIEGEGVYIGTKTLFIRLAGCPLHCYWCDTPYALSMKDGKEYEIKDAIALIDTNLDRNTFKANFTGGEPLLQHEAVYELAKYIKSKGVRTYLESSCFDVERFEYLLPLIDICKIEFKLKDSMAVEPEHHDELLKQELACLKSAIERGKATYIKVVVSNKSSKDEISVLAKEIFSMIDPSDIEGFVIQPVYGANKPSMNILTQFYDTIYPFYDQVRVIPQIQKVIGIR